MTDEQIQAFADDIAANIDPIVVAALAEGNNNGILGWYNSDTDPAELAWKNSVTVDEANDSIDWTEYMAVPTEGGDTLAGVKLAMEQNTRFARQNNSLNQLFRDGDFNPSLQTIRSALQAIFAGCPNTVAALLTIGRRVVNRIEKLFAGAVVQGALELTFEGSASLQNVRDAVALIPE